MTEGIKFSELNAIIDLNKWRTEDITLMLVSDNDWAVEREVDPLTGSVTRLTAMGKWLENRKSNTVSRLYMSAALGEADKELRAGIEFSELPLFEHRRELNLRISYKKKEQQNIKFVINREYKSLLIAREDIELFLKDIHYSKMFRVELFFNSVGFMVHSYPVADAIFKLRDVLKL